MPNDLDLYKEGKKPKKTDEPKIDLKNPAEVKKYQGMLAVESNKHKTPSVYQKRDRYPKTYQKGSLSSSSPNSGIYRPTPPTTGPNADEGNKKGSVTKTKIAIIVLLIIVIILAIIIIRPYL